MEQLTVIEQTIVQTVTKPVLNEPASPITNVRKPSVYAPPPISISISNPVVKENEPTSLVVAHTHTSKRNNPFTPKELLVLWTRFANEVIPEKTHAKNIMLNNRPVIEADSKLKIIIDQVIQENSLNEIAGELTKYLSNNLENDNIELLIEVDTIKENKKVMSPQDRFAKMTEINPALTRLRKEFGLEID
jgi:DNA polymerase-3 subunit gamma/tau